MNGSQAEAIQYAHQHLSQLVDRYNNFEITVHNWDAVLDTIKNLEKEFAFLPTTELELTRPKLS